MKCSFDQKEYCPLENVEEKGTMQWQMTIAKMFPNGLIPYSNPVTGGNYIFISGGLPIISSNNNNNNNIKMMNKKIAVFRTPIISSRVAGGQCLSFHYNIMNEKGGQLEINKVNVDGTVSQLFRRDNQNEGN